MRVFNSCAVVTINVLISFTLTHPSVISLVLATEERIESQRIQKKKISVIASVTVLVINLICVIVFAIYISNVMSIVRSNQWGLNGDNTQSNTTLSLLSTSKANSTT